MAGVKGKSGAPKGNKNAMTTGARLDLRRLVVGELPLPMIAVKREGRKYRRALENEVLQVKEEINITDAHHIDTATAATVQAGIARWLLRNRLKDEHTPAMEGQCQVTYKGQAGGVVRHSVGMSTADILRCMDAISKAKQIRDKAVAALKLDAPPPDPWATFDGTINGKAETESE